MSEPQTHDLSSKTFGRDYAFRPVENGQRGDLTGWCTPRPKEGDYLILRDGSRTTRYQIEKVRYATDPKDMFSADVIFAPRQSS